MTYRGFWIVCRYCLFPIRLPSLLKTSAFVSRSSRILLACPVCAHVEQYSSTELRAIAFRIPDPFRRDKATLYAVEVPCRVPHCRGKTWVYAVAATSLSVTSLLEQWKRWIIHSPCRNHSFRARQCWTWGVYGVRQAHQRIFQGIYLQSYGARPHEIVGDLPDRLKHNIHFTLREASASTAGTRAPSATFGKEG